MTQKKSELLSSMGTGFEILKAIVDSVTERGGTDDDFRRILKDKKIRKAVAEILIADQKFFTFIVDFDDPRWKEFPLEGDSPIINSEPLKPEHFPVRYSGKAEVTIEVLPDTDCDTLEEHLAIMKEKGALEIDRAISETFHEQFPHEHEKGYMASFCGVYFDDNANRSISYLQANDQGILLKMFHTRGTWSNRNRFLIVREVKSFITQPTTFG